MDNRARELRERLGISREDAARLSDTSYSYVQKLEEGRVKRPQHPEIDRIARVLGVTVNYLLGQEALIDDPDYPPIAELRATGIFTEAELLDLQARWSHLSPPQKVYQWAQARAFQARQVQIEVYQRIKAERDQILRLASGG